MTVWMRRLHKWLGLIIGLQVIVWLASGLAMNWLDPALIAGENVRAFEHDVQSLAPDSTLVAGNQILQVTSEEITGLELKRQHGFWVWRAETAKGIRLFDARTGLPLSIDAARVRAAAELAYFGDGLISEVTRLDKTPIEARDHSAPLWRVRFNDEFATRYYFAADDGRVVAHRNDTWAWFDFFWMLHTMDYVGRDDFNTPWVILFGFGALWLSISGVWLVIYAINRGRT